MITKDYIKEGARIKCIDPDSDDIYNSCGTITDVRWGHIDAYLEFSVTWDNLHHCNSQSYKLRHCEWFSPGSAPAKLIWRRATEKDFKHGTKIKCCSKRKGGFWKNELGVLSLKSIGRKKSKPKRFEIGWYNLAKVKRNAKWWDDFTNNFMVVKKKKVKKLLTKMPIDSNLPLLHAGHLQDRLMKRFKQD
jgi:hypothetical protein